jgi:hypothetical protein
MNSMERKIKALALIAVVFAAAVGTVMVFSFESPQAKANTIS